MILFRRIGVGCVLLAGLGFMCLAASNYAQGQGKKEADSKKPAARTAVDWHEKKYTVEIDGKKWEDVFTWLADQGDLPFVYSNEKAPFGTLKLISPKGRKYSLIEIFDLVNERLQSHEKFTLLRTDVSLSMFPADKDIPPSLIPRIPLSELPERGRTEIVELVIPLKGSLDAETVAPGLKRQLGPFGLVSAMPDTNKLIVRADVGTLRRHLPEYLPAKDEVTGKTIDDSAHTYTRKCTYVRASTAEAVLTKALGQSRVIVETKSAAATPMGGDDKTPPGGRPQGGGGQTSRKIREHIISSEKASNTVIITGPTDKIEQAKKILNDLDKPRFDGDKGLKIGPPLFKTHDLAGGSAEAMVKILADIFKSDDSIKITVSSPTRLFVWADPQTHDEISLIVKENKAESNDSTTYVHKCIYIRAVTAEAVLRQALVIQVSGATVAPDKLDSVKASLDKFVRIVAVKESNLVYIIGPPDKIYQAKSILEKLDVAEPKSPIDTVSVLLTRLEAAKFAETLKAMFPESKNSSPFIEADTDQNSIRLRGTPEEIKEVRAVIRVLDDNPLGVGGNLAIINMEKGSGATVAEALYLLFGKLRPDVDLKMILPGQLEVPDFKQPDKKPAVPEVKPAEKKITRLTPDKLREVMYLDDVKVSPVLFDAKEDKKEEKKKEPAKKKSQLIITGFGNRIIITSDDPATLDLARQMIRILVNTEAGPGDFEVINLKWASAVEVAKVLDEAFNGPKTQGGGQRPGGGLNIPGIGGLMGGIMGIGGGGQGARVENIRVVADAATNSLLIRAKPIDMLTIRRLIAKQLDVGNTDSDRIARPFIIGPLKNATAANVSRVIEQVYRDSMARTSQTFSQNSPGFSIFQQQRTSDPVSNQASQLTISPDDTTNSLVVQCSTTLFKDIKKLVDDLDDAAGNAKQVIKIVSIKDIDPLVVQQAIDSISGRSTAMQQRRPGDTTGTGVNAGSFAPGGFGTGGRLGGGGGFQGGGFNPGGGGFIVPGAFPGGGTGFPGGGGGGIRIPGGGGGRPGGGGGGPKNRIESERGSDFFVSRVMDDPSVSVLFDPSEEQEEPNFVPYRERYVKAPTYTANPIQFISLEQELVQPPKDKEPAPKEKGKDDVFAPRLPAQVEVLSDLGIMIIKTNNPGDMAAILEIIEMIRRASLPALIEIELVPVRLGDPVQIVNTLNQLFGRVTLGPYDTKIRAGGPVTGAPQQPIQVQLFPQGGQPAPQQQPASTAAQPTNIVMIPQIRLSAILVAASKARMPDIKKQIQLLDHLPSDPHHAKPYPLKRAAAAQVGQSLNTFYSTRYPAPDNINQIRITWDVGTNTVFVQASPADLAEIDRFIAYIDNNASKYESEVRVVQLRSAVATDLQQLLQLSIANGVLAVNQSTTGGAPLPLQTPGGLGGPQLPATKDGTLNFRPSNAKDGKPFETRILEDIRVNADIRTNSLVISAPKESMELVLALVRELDVPPNARSEINIFTLKKADATQMATMLQQLFLGTGALGTRTAAGGLPAAPAAGGVAGQKPPISISISGTTEAGAPIIDLRITIDERTNSLIVAGSRSDLLVVETIIARIEDANIQERRSEAVRLRNSQAVDIANAVTNFLTASNKVYSTYGQGTNSLEIMREVVVIAEPISNSLLINATPKYFDEVLNLIAKLDTAPPQVVIQVLIAEVNMNGSEEFGMEIGLENPLSFMRGLIPGGTTVTYTAAAGGGPGSPGTTPSTQPFGNPGFFFNNPNIPIPNNTGAAPRQLGMQALNNYGVGRVSSNSGLGGFVFSANADVVSVLIRALKIQNRVSVLSRPQLMTLDNQTAVIQVVTNFPIITGSSVVSNGVVTPPPIQHTPLGITLQVTPRITPDGRVVMRVTPEISAIESTNFPLGNGTVGTSYKTQHLETTVSATDGETIMLGGLITKNDEKNENKVPWLGDLPGIGAAFRYRTYVNKKVELVIIMTPHIIRNRQDKERILAEEIRRVDWSLADVTRVHGNANSLPCAPTFTPDTHSKTHPFRIYPGAPTAGDQAPETPPTTKAPIGRGGLLQSITGRKAAESTPGPLPTTSLIPGETTVKYLPPPIPTTPPIPPLPSLIAPGAASTPVPFSVGTVETMPPVTNIFTPPGR